VINILHCWLHLSALVILLHHGLRSGLKRITTEITIVKRRLSLFLILLCIFEGLVFQKNHISTSEYFFILWILQSMILHLWVSKIDTWSSFSIKLGPFIFWYVSEYSTSKNLHMLVTDILFYSHALWNIHLQCICWREIDDICYCTHLPQPKRFLVILHVKAYFTASRIWYGSFSLPVHSSMMFLELSSHVWSNSFYSTPQTDIYIRSHCQNELL